LELTDSVRKLPEITEDNILFRPVKGILQDLLFKIMVMELYFKGFKEIYCLNKVVNYTPTANCSARYVIMI